MTYEDIDIVLGILDKYDVVNWDSIYGETPDYLDCDPSDVQDGGACWYLLIQFDDGTVNRTYGYEKFSRSHPEGAEFFIDEMIAFTHSREETGYGEK